MWQPQYYQWLLDYLEKPENTKLFFWIVNEQIIVNYNPPHNLTGKYSLKISNILPANFNY
jgi:hypothetical protein